MELEKKTKFTEVANLHLKGFEKAEKELGLFLEKISIFLNLKLEATKVITNESLVKELNNLEDAFETSMKDLEKKAGFMMNRPIKIKFDPKITNIISNICQISYEESN